MMGGINLRLFGVVVYMASALFGPMVPLAQASSGLQGGQTQGQVKGIPDAGGVNPNFVFEFTQDPQELQSMNQAVKADSPDLSNGPLNDSYVLTKDSGIGGFWTSLGGTPYRKLSFDSSDTTDPMKNHLFAYTTSYYCANGRPTTDQPANGPYQEATYTVLVNLNDGFWKPVSHKAYEAISHFTAYKDASPSSGAPASENTIVDWDFNDIYGSSQRINDIRLKYGSCVPTSVLGPRKTEHILNRNDPAVKDSLWTGAEAAVENQKDANGSVGGGGRKSSSNAADKCDGGTFGWAICPILQNIQDGVNGIETGLIDPFLKTSPLSTESTEYKIWDNLRNLANVIFVLVFFVVIFGNLLSISAYTIKKMLPRLIAAAILVQASFLIVSIAVDITNVLGAGLFQLIDTAIGSSYKGSPGVGSGLALGIAFGGLAAAATAAALSGTIFIIAIGAFMGVLGVFFTLLFRQIVIVALIITAPLAFAAWVLPGTEKFFKTWMSNLIKILMMYPLIVMLFATSKVFGAAVSGADIPGAFKPIVIIMGTVGPLFLIPMTFKSGGQLFAMGQKAIEGQRNKGQKSLDNSAFAKNLRSNHDARKLEKLSARIDKGGATGWLAGASQGAVYGRNSAAGLAQINATQQSVMNEAKKRINTGNYSSDDLANAARGEWTKVSDNSRRALQGAMKTPAGMAAVHALAAEGGRYDAAMAASLVRDSGLNKQQAERAFNYVRTGDAGKKIREKNRVLATANIEAFQSNRADPNDPNKKLSFDANAVNDEMRKSIRNQVQGLSSKELAGHSSNDAMEMLADLGSDGVGQIRASSIAGLSNQRIKEGMTDKQRKAIYDAVSTNPRASATQSDFVDKINQQTTVVSNLTAGTDEHTKAQEELNRLVGDRQKAIDAVRQTRATIKPDGTL